MPVQCKTCGLLAIRHHLSFRPIEVIQEWRTNGTYNPPEGVRVPAKFFCQAHSAEFPERPRRGDHEPGIDDAVLAIRQIETTIECHDWMQWDWGDSPKRHLKMRALKEQRDYNRQMLESEREWKVQDRKDRASEAEKVEARHQLDSGNAERRFRWGLGFVIFGTVLGQILAAWLRPGPEEPKIIIAPQTIAPAVPIPKNVPVRPEPDT